MGNTLVNNPIASDTLAFDQPLMQGNNKYYAHTLIKDHQIGDSTANISGGHQDTDLHEGFHTVVHLVTQGGDPAPVNTIGEIYTKLVGGNTEIFYRYGSAPNNIFQLTNDGAIAAATGRSSLISPAATPLQIRWGPNSAPSSGTFAGGAAFGTVATGFSTTIYAVVITLSYGGTVPIGSGTVGYHITGTSFDWKFLSSSSKYDGFTWIAIGN